MLYHYVGPRGIAERSGFTVRGIPIASPEDVVRWITSTTAAPYASSEVTVTFVVNEEGTLLIADRHSEHVACAGNRPVRSAGEMCLELHGERVTVTRISNQSTGYCPEPESWADVVAALRAGGLEPTEGFDPLCEFRRCLKCAALNLVKCGVFECCVCEAELSKEYNCQP